MEMRVCKLRPEKRSSLKVEFHFQEIIIFNVINM